jgi:hypothetical protein
MTMLGMARGTLVVDENVAGGLSEALRDANFHVVVPNKRDTDCYIATTLLPNRIFVTKNPKDFVDLAPVYDFGIISVEKLSFIDRDPDFGNNKTAQLISRAIIDHELLSRARPFILTLGSTGRHTLRPLQ